MLPSDGYNWIDILKIQNLALIIQISPKIPKFISDLKHPPSNFTSNLTHFDPLNPVSPEFFTIPDNPPYRQYSIMVTF